jgi:hypothetical protein
MVIFFVTLFIVTLLQTLSLILEYAQMPYPFVQVAPQSNNHDVVHTCNEQSHQLLTRKLMHYRLRPGSRQEFLLE